MKVTSFEAIVENGQIILPAGLQLPERARVYVVVPDLEIHPIPAIVSPRLAHPEEASEFKKEVFSETSDADPGKI